MRVTNKMLSNNFMSDMRNNLNSMQTLQQQMSSGKEIRRPSDNPFKVARIMQLSSDIDANTQYNENISDTLNWLDTTDSALSHAGNVFQRIRELIVSAGNGAYGQQEKNAIKDEINAKVGELGQILNTNFDGKYLFAGTRADAKPITVVSNLPAANGTVSKTGLAATAAPSVSGFLPDGTVDTKFKITIGSITLGKVDSVDVQTSTDNGLTFSAVTTVPITPPVLPATTGSFTVLPPIAPATTGMSITIPDDVNNNIGEVLSFSSTAMKPSNSKLIYNNNNQAAPNVEAGPTEISKIKSKLSVEISQGVLLNYNVSAGDVLQFTNEKYETKDLRTILTTLTNHLDGKSDDGTIDDPTVATKLNTTDLQAVTDVINNLLKLRSEVGAKQNRIDSTKERNELENFNMTDLLSHTEDIDITKKTMEYSNAQTVYLASLQTSAKIIQPSLLDYIR